MKTFSHPPTVAVCTREREGWVGDGPKGSYLSNFRRLQKEQPRAAAIAAAAATSGMGRNRAYFDSFRKFGSSKAQAQNELQSGVKLFQPSCENFHQSLRK